MKKKIPPDAFAFYLGLGPGRSYQLVAERYGVSKRAVAFCSEREHWQARLAEEDNKVRERAEKAAAESNQSSIEKHLKVFRFIQGRSIETLKSLPIETAMDAVKAYGLAVDWERQLLGGTGNTSASVVEQITREEVRNLLTTRPVGADGQGDY